MAFVCSHDIVDKCVSRTLICYLTIKQAFGSEFSMYMYILFGSLYYVLRKLIVSFD